MKPLPVVTPTAGAAGSTAINGSIIDALGFEGVLFVLLFGAIVTGAVTTFKLTQSDNSDMSSPEDVAGSNQAVADTEGSKAFYLDIRKPTKRYLRLIISRGTQNATVSAVALPYGAKSQPVTQTAAGESFVGPAGGTA